MESVADLLRLPIFSESDGAIYFRYHDGWSTLASEHRLAWYKKCLREHHYDNISRLQYVLADHDARIRQLEKGASAGIRICIVEALKAETMKQLRVLETGWSRIADVLRTESQKLFVLPREVREQIYGYLYTRKSSADIIIKHADPDVRRSMLPADPFFYLNAKIVDPAVAAEAAQVLYDFNTFEVSLDHPGTLAQFLNTDHFGSGLIPRDAMRRLHSTLWPDCFRAYQTPSASAEDSSPLQSQGSTNLLAVLLEMQELRIMTLSLLGNDHECAVALHHVNLVVQQVKDKGVVVETWLEAENHSGDATRRVNVSRYFDKPTAAEYEELGRVGRLSFKAYKHLWDTDAAEEEKTEEAEGEEEEVVEVWEEYETILSFDAPNTATQWKVHLHELYQGSESARRPGRR